MDVSYLITVFNKENEIKETIACLQNQTLKSSINIEIICIDDFSSDNSVNIIENLQNEDKRIQIIKNQINLGPSKSLNIAAKIAKGKYLIPIDGDDFFPKDATQYLLESAKKHNVELVFGLSKRTKDIPNKVTYISSEEIHTNPLDFCIKKSIVHMGFLASKKLWEISGGVDEKVFIQDMSLPLRLSAYADSLVYLNSIIYYLRDESGSNLSDNTDQQHHDRFMTYFNLTKNDDIELSSESLEGINAKLISSIWKIKRDNSKFSIFSKNFLLYMANKVFNYKLNKKEQRYWLGYFNSLDSIRRPN